MNDWAVKLLALQDKDLRILKLEERLHSVPQEKATVQAQLQDTEMAVAEARSLVQECEKAIKTVEIDVEAINTKMRDFATKTTMIKDNNEYRAALTQIEKCKDQVGKLEDLELEKMEMLEKARTDLSEKQKIFKQTQERVHAMLADLDVREKNCQAMMEKLNLERSTAAAEVPTEIFNRYERLRKSARMRASGRVLVPLHDNACGSCHMKVTAQQRVDARKISGVICQYCGAMLYVEE